MKVYWPNVQTVRLLIEQKETAFRAWQSSGYRDAEAHREYVRLYELIQTYAKH